MKSMKMKRALLLLTLLVVILSAVTGGTIAWFTDTVESNTNVIQAGTLDVKLYASDKGAALEEVTAGSPALFNYDKWEPGYTVIKHIKVENAGSLSLKYRLSLLAENSSKLAEVIDVYALSAAATGRGDLDTPVGTLSTLLNNDSGVIVGALNANESSEWYLVLKMRESAGNEYQGLSVGNGFAVKLEALQNSDESDAFGADYDAGLQFGSLQYPNYDEVKNVDTVESVASALDMAKDVAAVLPAGETNVSAIALDFTGSSNNDFGIFGSNTTFTGDLQISSHRNFHLGDDAVLTIDGITVNGTLKVVAYYKNIVIKNVKAKSIEVNDGGSVIVDNCTLDSASDNGLYLVATANGYKATITNNVIKNSQKNAIQISGCASGATYGAGEVVVTGNTFENWCVKNDKPRAAFKVWGDSVLAPASISSANDLTDAAVALVGNVLNNNIFTGSNANQVKIDIYDYTCNTLE